MGLEEEAGDESNVRHSGEVVGKEVRPTSCEGSQLGRASAICIAVAIQDCGRAWPTHCLRLLEICLGGAYLTFVVLHFIASSLDSIFIAWSISLYRHLAGACWLASFNLGFQGFKSLSCDQVN